jgi:predicted Zn-dependent protease with MMP-like domain
MVAASLDGLPAGLGRLMSNVAVTVEHRPGPPGLLGLYEGIPLTSRTTQYAGVLPDRITIYHQAICALCRTEDEVADQVRRTASRRHRQPVRTSASWRRAPNAGAGPGYV